MKNLFILFTTLFLFSCTNKQENKTIQLSDFKRTINLSIDSGKIYTKKDIFNRAPYLYLLDTLLIAQDIFATEKGIHFFVNHKYLKSVCRIGKGENEIVRPGNLCTDKNGKYLWIVDWGRVTYNRYALDSLLFTNNFIAQKFNFPQTISYEKQVVSDTSLLFNTQYEEPYIYRIVSENGVQNFAKPQEILPGVEVLDHPLYMTTFKYDTETQRIYMAFRNLDVLMCIDTTGKVIFTKKFFNEIGFKKKVKKDRNEISTFSFLKIFGNKIFVLYCGLEYFQGGNVGQPVPNFPEKLMIFDMKGNPLTLIKFDGEIFDYVYDTKNKELIVYSLSSEIYPLIYYKIEL
ncbi:MAG: TolB-like 6-bladed beta-propeller domain-containing protein [Bacteroidales bacterium]|nr:TolB-like 6-bladed beta-propeller domain-containing protein [Bacteroidales bacterium]